MDIYRRHLHRHYAPGICFTAFCYNHWYPIRNTTYKISFTCFGAFWKGYCLQVENNEQMSKEQMNDEVKY